MLTRVTINFILILTLFGCRTSTPATYGPSNNFNYIKVSEPFELTVTEFYENSATCATEALPYALIIGTTSTDKLPSKISVLSWCDNRLFRAYDKLTVEPTDNPMDRTTLNPLYFVKDTTLNGSTTRWLIGSEHPAIWGTPTLNE